MKLDPSWLTFGLSDEQVKGAVTVGWRAIIFFHIAFACNYLAFLGFPGFALAADQKATDDKLNTLLQLELSNRIRALAYEKCLVIGQDVKEKKADEIETWQIEYKKVAGERYPEPAC